MPWIYTAPIRNNSQLTVTQTFQFVYSGQSTVVPAVYPFSTPDAGVNTVGSGERKVQVGSCIKKAWTPDGQSKPVLFVVLITCLNKRFYLYKQSKNRTNRERCLQTESSRSLGLKWHDQKEEGKLLAGRRALHSCAPHCCNLIGRELPGAELKLVERHEALQFIAIFCTNSKVARIMASFFGKHLIYPSNGVPKSMADLRRYEGFFPNMSGATYDPISLMNEEKNHSREPSRSFSSDSTTPSHDDGHLFEHYLYVFKVFILFLWHGNFIFRSHKIVAGFDKPSINMCISIAKY